jgi:hypothetical protein
MQGGLRLGAVLEAKQIRCSVDVTPYFGEKAERILTCTNAVEISEYLNLNKYSDKETFHLLRECRTLNFNLVMY